MRLAIFGTGGMGRELADLVRRGGREAVFVTDDPVGPIQGIEVIGPHALEPEDEIIFAIGSSSKRKLLAERFARHRCGRVISPTAIVSPSAEIGEGSAVCDYAVINNSSVVGRHFQANVFSQVSHDCIIGDFVTFSPRASCNGWVQVDDGAFVGAGAVIRNGSPNRRLRIGKDAVIGMGAVVISDVPDGVAVVGVPAKPL